MADVLHWTPEAKESWSLRFLTDDVKHAAMHDANTYEAHTIGVWTKDFKYAPTSCLFLPPVHARVPCKMHP